MTHLELETARGAYKVAFIFESIFTFFGKIYKAIHNARQDKANRMVAEMMRHEYPHETYDYILRLVEEGRINELHK